jgi:hypothetical protein
MLAHAPSMLLDTIRVGPNTYMGVSRACDEAMAAPSSVSQRQSTRFWTRTSNTDAELPVELGVHTWHGLVTKIRYLWVCKRPFYLLLNFGTRSKVTIYTYSAEPMGTIPMTIVCTQPYVNDRVIKQGLRCRVCVAPADDGIALGRPQLPSCGHRGGGHHSRHVSFHMPR